MKRLLLSLALTVVPYAAAKTVEHPLSKLTTRDVCITETVSISTAEDVSNLFLLDASETIWALTYKYSEEVSFSGHSCVAESQVTMTTQPAKKGLAYTVTLELLQDKQVIWSSSTIGKAKDFGGFQGIMSQELELNYQRLVRDWQAAHPEGKAP